MNIKHNALHTFSREIIKIFNDSPNLGIINYTKHSDDGVCDIIGVDFYIQEFPQYPVIMINKIEKITITIKEDEIPTVSCRDDFPAVPHLNIYEDGSRTLCLYDTNYRNIRHQFNASEFVSRISWWFSKTTRGKLHHPNQTLEPFFPHVLDCIIFLPNNRSSGFKKMIEIQTPYNILLKEVLYSHSEGKFFTEILLEMQEDVCKNIINKLPTTLGELEDAFGTNLEQSLLHTIGELWNVKQKPEYKHFFDQQLTKLKNCEVIITLKLLQCRERETAPETATLKVFKLDVTLGGLFSIFDIKDKKNIDNYRSIQLFAFDVQLSLNRHLATLFNGTSTIWSNDLFLQIGAGALGSQLAEQCARSGFGKWIYVDFDILFPHNLARHCLDSRYIGKNKAEGLTDYFHTIFYGDKEDDYQFIHGDILDNDFTQRIVEVAEKVKLIVDCTASVSSARHLCHSLAKETRCVSFFMNPAGTSLIMLLESENRDISLDVLEMQYYKSLYKHSKLETHLEQKEMRPYSSDCRSVSNILSQDNIAIFSGICSNALKKMANKSESCIRLWTMNELSLDFFEKDGEEFLDYSLPGNRWKILISKSLRDCLFFSRAKKLPLETGGVLIGNFDFYEKICYIVDFLPSPSDSKEYPNAFVRGRNDLGKEIERVETITAYNLTYIGEWHTHTTNDTNKSEDDCKLLHSISTFTSAMCRPGCMIIVGETQLSVYLEDQV